MKQCIILVSFVAIFSSCVMNEADETVVEVKQDSIIADTSSKDSSSAVMLDSAAIDTKNISPDAVVGFAKTLIGVPYKYASTDPSQGFDCSGFITYVFNHFKIEVPRSSIDFTNVGKMINKDIAMPGDLILFTGTDSLDTKVGHMGIVTENNDSLRFIHSTSGKKYGVTITPLNEFYLKRFVKVVRIF